MAGIDETKTFHPLNIAVLTVSDTRTMDDDKSGKLLAERLKEAGHHLSDRAIVKDEIKDVQSQVKAWCANLDVDVVITTGGTGFTGRDVTREALQPLYDKEIEGFSTLFHMISFQKVGTSTIQSRASGGLIDLTFVFSLPGSPGACKDGWDEILKYQLDSRHRPCNFAELMPRLAEK